MGFPGRPAAHPEIYEIGVLTQADLDSFEPEAETNEPGVLARMRDHHHRIAHLCAMGLRNGEIHEITGISTARISVIRKAPAFVELVETYRKEVNAARLSETDQHFVNIVRLRNLAVGELIDRFEDDDQRDKISTGHLIAIAADGSDRTGYPKRRESVNMNMDFASRLDRAIERSNGAKLIEGEVMPPNTSAQPEVSGDGRGGQPDPNQEALPVPFRRRV